MPNGFPSTRYAGSKLKIVDWIWENVKDLDFDSCLDAFGGMASVSYLLKKNNKTIYFNDILKCCMHRGISLIENNSKKVSKQEVINIMKNNDEFNYIHFISDTFNGIYFTDEENEWLDMVIQNILNIDDRIKKSILLSALHQACLIKRPFNLFHRKNLYLRLNNVERNFNNHVNWEVSFEDYMYKFVEEINRSIFDNNKKNIVYNEDIFNLNTCCDLVYLDPPYLKKVYTEDYMTMYHFLEGTCEYYDWKNKINYDVKTKKYKNIDEILNWNDRKIVKDNLKHLFKKFRKCKLVMSYRNDGVPSKNEIKAILKQYYSKVKIVEREYQYVLSKKTVKELLFIAE